jgi:hypothetical protein
MRIIKLTTVLILFFINLNKIFSQNLFIPTEFVATTIPIRTNDYYDTGKEWLELNHSKGYEVTIKNDSIVINQYNEINEELKAFDGLLIGIDRGEFFGGGIKFISNSGEKKAFIFENRNIISIFKFQDRIFFIEKKTGIIKRKNKNDIIEAPINGVLFELYYNNNVFSHKHVLNFEDTPHTAAVFENKIYVASNSGFYVIENMQKLLIFRDLFWFGLYPNSIAIKNDENVFVGIRGGIVKLDLNTKIIDFYKYSPKID